MKRLPVLLLGPHVTSVVAARFSLIGFEGVPVADPDALRDEVGQRDQPAILIDADLSNAELEGVRRAAGRIRVVCSGPDPGPGQRDRLRQNGVRTALWPPVTDGAIQYVLAQAAKPPPPARQHERVPTERTAIVTAAGERRTSGVYEISEGGAFLATMRPLDLDQSVEIVLRLPGRELGLAATVVWRNHSTGDRHDRHPTGMAIRFVDVPGEDHEALRAFIAQERVRYEV